MAAARNNAPRSWMPVPAPDLLEYNRRNLGNVRSRSGLCNVASRLINTQLRDNPGLEPPRRRLTEGLQSKSCGPLFSETKDNDISG